MTSLEHLGYRQELQRALTFRDLLVYGMVFMVPISPFGVFGFVYKDAKGMVPLAVIGYVLYEMDNAAKIMGAVWIALGIVYFAVHTIILKKAGRHRSVTSRSTT
jgi:hypothetical protein